jgi:GDP-4-dehydro-6-deoxy-D-mannose reductase
MKALITGCNGFVGKHLAEHLRSKGDEVHGLDRQASGNDYLVGYHQADLSDEGSLESSLDGFKPEVIYHLAAVANPRECNLNPALALKVNIGGTGKVLEFCRLVPETRLLCVGSAEQYRKKDGFPQVFSEQDELDPRNVYGATKIAAEALGRSYVAQYGAKVFFTRSFNHSGPGQLPTYALSSFTLQFAEMALGRRPLTIETGNLAVSRDFLDVRDVVRAYRCIVEKGEIGEAYNVSSGKAYTLGDIIELLRTIAGLPDVRIVQVESLIRVDEPREIKGLNMKLTAATGWIPLYSIERTITDLYRFWIDELRSSTIGSGLSINGEQA